MYQRHIVGLRAFALALILAFANLAVAQSEVADAAMQRDKDLVRQLLQQGFEVNIGQADGATALHWAAYYGDVGLAEMLLEAGADISADILNVSSQMCL